MIERLHKIIENHEFMIGEKPSFIYLGIDNYRQLCTEAYIDHMWNVSSDYLKFEGIDIIRVPFQDHCSVSFR